MSLWERFSEDSSGFKRSTANVILIEEKLGLKKLQNTRRENSPPSSHLGQINHMSLNLSGDLMHVKPLLDPAEGDPAELDRAALGGSARKANIISDRDDWYTEDDDFGHHSKTTLSNLSRKHKIIGYTEGIIDEKASQEGFNQGFKTVAHKAFLVGAMIWCLASFTAVESDPDSQKVSSEVFAKDAYKDATIQCDNAKLKVAGVLDDSDIIDGSTSCTANRLASDEGSLIGRSDIQSLLMKLNAFEPRLIADSVTLSAIGNSVDAYIDPELNEILAEFHRVTNSKFADVVPPTL